MKSLKEKIVLALPMIDELVAWLVLIGIAFIATGAIK